MLHRAILLFFFCFRSASRTQHAYAIRQAFFHDISLPSCAADGLLFLTNKLPK
jgi:hypothetical protein